MLFKFNKLYSSILLGILSSMGHVQAMEAQTIAITQIVSHPSLDKIRDGILDALKDNGFSEKEGTTFILDNASGNMAIATQIAQKYTSLKPAPRVIVAITTPSAQTMNKAIQGTQIPLIFAAVTDPVGAGLISSPNKASKHVTGTIDLPPMEKQLELIKVLLPKAKKIGILYTLAEANAVFQMKKFSKLAEKNHYKITNIGVSKTSDIPQAAEKLSQGVDVILLFNDNLIIASLESILKAADAHKIPVLASDPDSVKRGALAAIANDQYEVGRQTGQMVSKLLKGVPLSQLPPAKVTHTEAYVNDKVAQTFKMDPDLLKQAQAIK